MRKLAISAAKFGMPGIHASSFIGSQTAARTKTNTCSQ
jgi:hypothetical protein